MAKYKVYYRLSNDYDMTVDAKDDEDAKEMVGLAADENNQYDWVYFIKVEKIGGN